MIRRVALSAIVAVLAATAVGCGGAGSTTGDPAASTERSAIGDHTVPAQILDLTTTPEDIKKQLKQGGADTYVTTARLWSLRDGDRLRATLEIGRLTADAKPEDETFRQRIASMGTAGTVRWIDGREIYVRKGNQQAIYVWFSGIHFLILSVSGEYPAARALLRAVMAVKP